ncbi:MAG: damage-control phosphatase ARMT1 family protein [Candidatus Helarchaeota archaeon]
MNLDCVICFQRQALRALKDIKDIKTKERVLRSVMVLLLNEDWTSTPPKLAGKVYKQIKDITGFEDPYKEEKKKSNDIGLEFYDTLKEKCLQYSEPIKYALKLAVGSNIIDYGVSDSNEFFYKVEELADEKYVIDESLTLLKKLEEARSILYFADNSGEIVMDKLLLELIMDKYSNIEKITFVVKAGPIINDATMEDVEYVSLKKIPKIQFRTIGNELYPDSPSRDSPEVKRWIIDHDIVISKGQGNYEGLSIYKDMKKIFFLLIAKCPIVARDLNVEINSFVIYH